MADKKTSKKPVKKENKEKKTPSKSAKGMYHYIGEAWKKPDSKILKERMVQWRKDPAQVKVDKPLRLDRARALGYKAKKDL